MKPHIRLRKWSRYRQPQFYCTDGKAEGWGDTIPEAFAHYQHCKEDLDERASQPKRKWK